MPILAGNIFLSYCVILTQKILHVINNNIIQQQYLITTIGAPSDMKEKRITSDPITHKRPDVFLDKIVWMANRIGFPFSWNVYLYDLKNNELVKNIVKIPMQAGLASISGNLVTWIGYAWWQGPGAYFHDINTDITQRIPFAPESLALRVKVSENLILVSSTLKNKKKEIHLYNPETNKIDLLTNIAESYGDISGDQIVWTQINLDGSLGIFLYKISSKQGQFLPLDVASPNNPVISDQGIAWEDIRGHNNVTSINLYDFGNNKQKYISNKDIKQTKPAISGHRIVWIDYRHSRKGDVYSYNMKSDQETRITEENAIPLSVAIHGQQIVWDDNRNGLTDIYLWDTSNDTSPIIDPIADKEVTEGQPIQFPVTASSFEEQDITLSAEINGEVALEQIDANFVSQGNGKSLFEWTAKDTVYGEKLSIIFRATNSNGLSHEINVLITICFPAIITSPPLNQPLSKNVTFEWQHCEGVTDYWLMLGSCQRMGDIYDNFEEQKTNVTVSNIPQDGRTIYVTLKARMNGNWIERYYSYQSEKISAKLKDPSLGAILQDTQIFKWDSDPDILFYELLVGSCPFKGDIYQKIHDKADTEADVNNIPQNGKDVYVTLKSFINNTWVEEHDSFKTAKSIVLAELTTPNDSDVLGEKQNFIWTPGTNISGYWLKVGTSESSSDIYDEFKKTDNQTTVSQIPQNGKKIYVTLSSLVYGEWIDKFYNFKTRPATLSIAELIKPVAGIFITSEKVEFKWTPGLNVTRYWLMIGTSEGLGDIYDQSQGENLSMIVSGIPLYGEKIYITLRSEINEIWHDNLYNFTTKILNPAWEEIYKFLSENRTKPGGLPLSYKTIPSDYWLTVNYPDHQRVNDNRSIIERLIVKNSVNIYDAATGQIAEMLLGHTILADQQTQRLLSGRSGDLNTIRADSTPPFLYNKTSVGNGADQLDPKQTWFFRTISDQYLQSDPIDGKTEHSGFPEFNRLHHVDWKPIAGEQAWAAMIGPLQLAHTRPNPLASSEVQLALSILPAIDAMQSPIGGILHAPEGTANKDPRDISNENNESLYSGLIMLLKILKPYAGNEQIDKNIATIKRILFGDETNPGIEGYFKNHTFNTKTGLFDQGGLYIDDPNHPNHPFQRNTILAVDVQTWGVLVLGTKKIDDWFGHGTAFRIWETTKLRSGFYDQKGKLRGVGYTDQHNVTSAEWGLGAVMMTKALYRHYNDIDTEETQNWAKECLSDSVMMRQGIEEMKVLIEGDCGTAYKYANIRYEIPFGWWANPIPSLASTSWIVMADTEFNPFELGGGQYYKPI